MANKARYARETSQADLFCLDWLPLHFQLMSPEVILGPFGDPLRNPARTATDAVATIFRGQIWDPLQLPPAVTRSYDPLLTLCVLK